VRDNRCFLDVSTRFRDHDAACASIVAHEMAHYALFGRKVVLEDTLENEELTDALMVMAGFGPLMLGTYHDELVLRGADRIVWNVSRLGYLHPTAIAYLTLLQCELAGVDPEKHLDWSSSWYAEPWSVRRRLGERPRVLCRLCGGRLGEPDPGTLHYGACPVCAVVQPIRPPPR
jgi:hypothetical protein